MADCYRGEPNFAPVFHDTTECQFKKKHNMLTTHWVRLNESSQYHIFLIQMRISRTQWVMADVRLNESSQYHIFLIQMRISRTQWVMADIWLNESSQYHVCLIQIRISRTQWVMADIRLNESSQYHFFFNTNKNITNSMSHGNICHDMILWRLNESAIYFYDSLSSLSSWCSHGSLIWWYSDGSLRSWSLDVAYWVREI